MQATINIMAPNIGTGRKPGQLFWVGSSLRARLDHSLGHLAGTICTLPFLACCLELCCPVRVQPQVPPPCSLTEAHLLRNRAGMLRNLLEGHESNAAVKLDSGCT